MTIKEALAKIIENREEPSLNYAIDYAKAGLTMEGEMLRVQCLYVSSNISRWRGEVAKEVRATIKEFIKRSKELERK